MGGFFNTGKRVNNQNPVATSLRTQTSVQGRAKTIGWGQNRIAGNVVWTGDFRAIKQSSGGKGGGIGGKGQPGSYTYRSSCIISIGNGPIDSVRTLFNGTAVDFFYPPDASVLEDLKKLNIKPKYNDPAYPATFLLGTQVQTSWPYLSTTHATEALAYRGEALACFANLNLNSSPSIPNLTFEVRWGLNSSSGSTTADVNPADVIVDLIGNDVYGLNGFPTSLLDSLDSFRLYCRALGLFVSPVLNSQVAASSFLMDLTKSLCAEFRWSSGKLSLVPYVDYAVTGNGVTFTPDTTAQYVISEDALIPIDGDGGALVKLIVKRAAPSKKINKVQVEYLDRSNLYNPATIYAVDEAGVIDAGSVRLSDLRSNHHFCTESAASTACSLQLEREQHTTRFTFCLPGKFVRLDPMDIVTLNLQDTSLGLVNVSVRILEITETDQRTLMCVAEEFLGVATPSSRVHQRSSGDASNSNVDPGDPNPPFVFEPPWKLAGSLEIWVAASGEDITNWGGCHVWVSFDGVSYSRAGSIEEPARTGTLVQSLAAIATSGDDPVLDNVHTLRVSTAESGGELFSGSSQDAGVGNTLLLVGSEYLSYTTATLVAPSVYDLTGLVRGLHGTTSTVSAHAVGTRFVRLDDTVLKIPYTAAQIGSSVYVKMTSFNIFGTSDVSLADVDPVTITLAGTSRTPATLSALGIESEIDAAISDAIVAELVPISAAIEVNADANRVAHAADDELRRMIVVGSEDVHLNSAAGHMVAQQLAADALGAADRAAAAVERTQQIVSDASEQAASDRLVVAAKIDDSFAAVAQVEIASVNRDRSIAGTIDQTVATINGETGTLDAAVASMEARRAGEAASALAAQALAGVDKSSVALAELDRSLASDRSVWIARIGEAESAIERQTQVMTEADQALAQDILTLSGTVSTDLATVDGRIDTLDQVLATEQAVSASRSDTLTSGIASGEQDAALIAALAHFAAGEQIGQLSQTVNITLSGIKRSESTVSDLTRSVADISDVMTARFGIISADYTSLVQAQASALGALTASVVGISATSSAGTAGGRIQFVTSSSPGSGVQAAYDLQVSGTVGGAFNAAGLRVQYNADGSTAIVLSADRFFVEAGATRQTVFVANSDGFTLAGVTQFGSTVRSTATNSDGSPKWQIKPTGELVATNATISGVIKGATLDVGEALRFGAGARLRNGQLPWPYAFFDYLHEFYVDPSLAVQRVGISPERIGLALNIAQLGIDSATSASLDANRQLMAPVGAGDGSLGAWLMPDGTFRKTGSLTTLPALGDQSQGDIHPLIWDPDFSLQSGTPKTCICWARGEDEILTVPAGVSSLTLKLWGGGGSRPGNSTHTAGAGGAVQLTLAVTPGEKLLITVGLGGCFGDARTFGYWSGASAPHVDSPINGFARAGKGLFNATPLQTASGGGATIVSRINADGSETILGIAGGGGAASTSADGTPGGPYQSGVTGGSGGVNGASCTANGQGAGGGGAEGGALTNGGTNYIVSGATSTQSVAGSASAPPLTSDTHYQAHLTRMNFLSGAPARRAPGYGAETGRPPIGPLVAAGGDVKNGGSSAIGLYYGAQPGSSGLAVLIFN